MRITKSLRSLRLYALNKAAVHVCYMYVVSWSSDRLGFSIVSTFLASTGGSVCVCVGGGGGGVDRDLIS